MLGQITGIDGGLPLFGDCRSEVAKEQCLITLPPHRTNDRFTSSGHRKSQLREKDTVEIEYIVGV